WVDGLYFFAANRNSKAYKVVEEAYSRFSKRKCSAKQDLKEIYKNFFRLKNLMTKFWMNKSLMFNL
ncbi:hypothetical protein, partial [Legionella pneumophila]